MSVAEADALLYLSGHTRSQLERALRIPALAAGWRGSFQAMLEQKLNESQATGNAGLSIVSPPPAWAGFRPMRVLRIDPESRSVSSLVFVPDDGQALASALPGQFVVLRLRLQSGAPPGLRTYSLSDLPGAGHYRVSIKQEKTALPAPIYALVLSPATSWR